jgi:hypothetical protein
VPIEIRGLDNGSGVINYTGGADSDPKDWRKRRIIDQVVDGIAQPINAALSMQGSCPTLGSMGRYGLEIEDGAGRFAIT